MPSTREYYLVFYHDIHSLLNRFIQLNEDVKYIQYGDFDEIKEIGYGGYGTIYTAEYKKYIYSEEKDDSVEDDILFPGTVVLKRFKSFDEMPELFISEVSNN